MLKVKLKSQLYLLDILIFRCKESNEPSPKKAKPESDVPTEASLLEILGFTETKSLDAHCLTFAEKKIEARHNIYIFF